MWSRLLISLIAAFWIVMMVLLWREEVGYARPVGAAIPANLVWDRLLTAPDASNLEIRHGTNRVGFCRWRPDVGQEFGTDSRTQDTDDPLEGMVRHVAYYTLDLDGTVSIPEFPTRARFVFNVRLNTNRVWERFTLKITLRPDVYEISANAAEKMVRLHVDAGADKFERAWRFADFNNPQKLLAELGGPALPLLLGVVGPINAGSNAVQTLGIKWDARNVSMLLGKNKVRTFRLDATLLDRHHLKFYVSPVGEVLRVELPGKVSLVNDALAALQYPND